jgi:hypothetical protein
MPGKFVSNSPAHCNTGNEVLVTTSGLVQNEGQGGGNFRDTAEFSLLSSPGIFQGGNMRRLVLLLTALMVCGTLVAAFKPKAIKPKKPDQYQASIAIGAVTYAADLLLDGKAQKEFFYKELTASGMIAVRLAVFNTGRSEVVLPVEGVELLGPSGKPLPMVEPGAAADAILDGVPVAGDSRAQGDKPVRVSPNVRSRDPRYDPSDPRYDPQYDPNDPNYDPSYPRTRTSDPRYNDPNYDPRYGGSGYPRPGVIINPRIGGGGGRDSGVSQFEKELVEKDFNDKAHSSDPIDGSMVRDRFFYFSLADRPLTNKGFALRIPPGKGIPQEILLRF